MLGLLLGVSGLVVVAGTAGATSTSTGITMTSSGTPPLPTTGNGTSGAGSLTVTLAATLESGAFTLTLHVAATISGTVDWAHYTITTKRIAVVGTPTVHGTRLGIPLGSEQSGLSANIHVSAIEYSTASAVGMAKVTATVASRTASVTNGTFYTHPTPPSMTLSSSASPTQISAGDIGASAATWTLAITGTETGPNGWAKGDEVKVTVMPPGGAHCGTSARMSFWDSPTVTVQSASGVSVTPAVSEKLTSTCGLATPNELVLTFTNTGVFDEATKGSIHIRISGIKYTVGSTATTIGTGDVVVDATYTVTTPASTTVIGVAEAANATITASTPSAGGGTSGGAASGAGTSGGGTGGSTAGMPTVTADLPPVSVLPAASAASISPISITESAPGQLKAGYVCATLGAGAFDTAVQPVISIKSGDGQVNGSVSFQGAAGVGAPTLMFRVSKASTAATTYELSDLAVDAPTARGAVTVSVMQGASAQCSADTGAVGTAAVFSVAGTPVTRVAGSTVDGTAAAELEHQFDANGTACPGTQNSRPVVLATDAGFSDALAASYLAGTLGTGELLTPPGALASVTEQAIEREGITNVYVVGGPLAVSASVVDQIEALPVVACGGGGLAGASGAHVQVTRIFGPTAYGTAEWVAEYPAATDVGSVNLAGAYAGTNQTGGQGRYNVTAGAASAAPSSTGRLPTAILATGRTFQDAESASALSYADHLPVLLTTPTSLSAPAAAALVDLGIRQVIVMGGPDAVSNAVVTALEDRSMSVLRVAGSTYAETAVKLADLELAPASSAMGLGWSPTGTVTVARGDYFSDGIAGAVVAADAVPASTGSSPQPAPLLLTTGPGTVGPYLTAFLVRAGAKGIDDTAAAKVDALTVLGGSDAVTAASVNAMLGDL